MNILCEGGKILNSRIEIKKMYIILLLCLYLKIKITGKCTILCHLHDDSTPLAVVEVFI